jgi:hypothetical protein
MSARPTGSPEIDRANKWARQTLEWGLANVDRSPRQFWGGLDAAMCRLARRFHIGALIAIQLSGSSIKGK